MQAKPTTKEQLLYYLLTNVNLGTYDSRFLHNVQETHITDNKPVTTNQADLLDKITLRYARQLRQKEIDAAEMVLLPWALPPIQSLPEYTEAYVIIEDNQVLMRSPYKKEFITALKDTSLSLTWTRETKTWSAPYSEASLKHMMELAEKHYPVINYCPVTVDIINTLAEYETCKYWNPTLINAGGNYMIAATNKNLDAALAEIALSLNLATIARLVCYGVHIPTEIYDELLANGYTEEQIKFAIDFSPVMNMHDPATIAECIRMVNADQVIISERLGINSRDMGSLQQILSDNNIPCYSIDRRSDINQLDISKYEFLVIINTGMWVSKNQLNLKQGASKSIHLANSKPIKIK